MARSEIVSDLAAALVAFQAVVPTIPKNRTAKIPTKSGGSYSYKYADLSDMWDAIRQPLKDNNLAVTQSLVGGSSGWTGIKTTVWHGSGQFDSETVEVQSQGRSPQEIGSQITYFKRYALSAALGISTEEDDDGSAATHAPKSEPASVASLADVKAAADRAGASKEDVEAYFKGEFNVAIADASQASINAAVKHFTELPGGAKV